MAMEPNSEHTELKAILLENQRLLTENNVILKKLHRDHVRGLWFKAAWVVFILIAPMIVLYYYLLPFYSSLYSVTDSPAAGGKMQDLNEMSKLLQSL
jgi:hypothetical protein